MPVSSEFIPHMNPQIVTDEQSAMQAAVLKQKKTAPATPGMRAPSFDPESAKAAQHQQQQQQNKRVEFQEPLTQTVVTASPLPQQPQKQQLPKAANKEAEDAIAITAQRQMEEQMLLAYMAAHQSQAKPSYLIGGSVETTCAAIIGGTFLVGALAGWYFFGRSGAEVVAQTATTVVELAKDQKDEIVKEVFNNVVEFMTKS